MRHFKWLTSVVTACFLLVATSALAGPFPSSLNGGGTPTAIQDTDGVPDLYESYNQITGAGLSDNQGLDSYFFEPDEVWDNNYLAGGASLISLTAGNENTLGVYDLDDDTQKTDVLGPETGFGFTGDGTQGNPYPFGTLTPNQVDSGEDFGWFLTSEARDGSENTWYSESNKNNDGQWDHMMTFDLGDSVAPFYVADGEGVKEYQLSDDAFMIGWEDLAIGNGNSDLDYDDMVYIVDKNSPTQPVPEPATMLLLGTGLLGIAAVGRKKILRS